MKINTNYNNLLLIKHIRPINTKFSNFPIKL